MEDLTGRQFGPYQIVAPLGEGGMAAVYKAYQPAIERYVALKVLPRHFASDPQFTSRFQREAKLLAKLQHPNILPVFDFGQSGEYSYIAMPFIPSGTLTSLLSNGPLPLTRIRDIITQVGEALHYAHAHGMIHRDVKPSNVLIDESGICRLTDFGLARMVDTSLNLTGSGTVVGTPAYMSPEQGTGQKVDARSDIYSLGIMLYEMATGRVPYKAETPVAIIFKHVQDPLPPARTFNPSLPEAVERIILKALSKHPEDRYQTAGDMVRALQAAVQETLLIPSEKPSGKAGVSTIQPRRRLPVWIGFMIGIMALTAILGSLYLGFYSGNTPQQAVIPGSFGSALKLNGINSYGKIPYAPSLDLQKEITIEAWVRVKDFPSPCQPVWAESCGYVPIISQGHKGSTAGNFTLAVGAKGLLFSFETIDTRLMAYADIPVKEWVHVAVSHMYGNSSKTTVYLNGKPVEETQWMNDAAQPISGDGFPGPNSRSEYYIGQYGSEGVGDHFNGEIDELRVWNTARSQDEILAHMNLQLDGNEPGLVAYWDFNIQPGETVIPDESGNDHNINTQGTAEIIQR